MKRKFTIELTEQQLNDVLSAISFTLRKYPNDDSKNFKAALERISNKLWKVLRGKYPKEPAYADITRVDGKRVGVQLGKWKL